MDRKKALLQIAIKQLEYRNIDQMTVTSLCQTTGLPASLLDTFFPGGDRQLQMDATAFAGAYWLEQIEKKISSQPQADGKLSLLVREYGLGSSAFAASLSSYIDLWKKANDGDRYIRDRLAQIYEEYTNAFIDMARQKIGVDMERRSLRCFAQLLTVLSDVLHVQHMLGNPVDFECIGDVLSDLAKAFLLRDMRGRQQP